MQNELSVEIDRPINEVFSYTTKHVADWSKSVVEDEVVEDRNDGGEGTKFRVVTEEQGRKMEFAGEVIRHEPPRLSAVFLRGDHFDIDVEYRFEDLGGGRTRVTQKSAVTGKGFTKVILRLFGWLMRSGGRRALEADFATLKQQLEDPQPT